MTHHDRNSGSFAEAKVHYIEHFFTFRSWQQRGSPFAIVNYENIFEYGRLSKPR